MKWFEARAPRWVFDSSTKRIGKRFMQMKHRSMVSRLNGSWPSAVFVIRSTIGEYVKIKDNRFAHTSVFKLHIYTFAFCLADDGQVLCKSPTDYFIPITRWNLLRSPVRSSTLWVKVSWNKSREIIGKPSNWMADFIERITRLSSSRWGNVRSESPFDKSDQ